MQFLANENFPLASISLIKDSGYKTFSVLQETPGAKDKDILQRAAEQNLIILTFDRDYGELIFKYQMFIPEGIVYFRFDPINPEEPADILLKVITNSNLKLVNKFTVIERDKLRQRDLK